MRKRVLPEVIVSVGINLNHGVKTKVRVELGLSECCIR